MRAFVTGASGYIGSEVVRVLVATGHEVTGLTHTPENVSRIEALGAQPVLGDIRDPAAWSERARGHDTIVHLAFDYGAPAEADLAAIDTLREVGRTTISHCHMIYTSGCWVLGDTGDEPADEEQPLENPARVVAWRPAHEEQVLGSSDETFATAVIRPGMVYGGGGGLLAGIFETAAGEGAAEIVGEGDNRWSMVHREDLARLYLTVAEGRASGVFHGVDGRPLRVREVGEAASRAAGAGGRIRSIPLTQARQQLGLVADALLHDQALEPRRSRELGWEPRRSSFADAAEEAFADWRASTQ